MAQGPRNKLVVADTAPALVPNPTRGISNLKPHATVTPLSCVGTSKIPERGLAVIEWTLFDGISQKAAIPLYNNFGYASSHPVVTKDAISYAFRKYGPIWYVEQGARRPWRLYNRQEKVELAEQGLGEEDFPFVHPRDLAGSEVAQAYVAVDLQQRDPSAKGSQGGGAAPEALDGELIANPPERHPSPSPTPVLNGNQEGAMVSSHKKVSKDDRRSIFKDMPIGNDLGSRSTAHYNSVSSIQKSPTASQPLPFELKIAILSKHIEWLEANVVAYNTGSVAAADSIEPDLETLENQAVAINTAEFRAWKFEGDGYGAFASRNDTLVSFAGLDILRERLKDMQESFAQDSG